MGAVFTGAPPDLSIVVTVVDAGTALVRCLEALRGQTTRARLEILVPFDATRAEVSGLAARFPGYRFLALGTIVPTRPPGSPAGEHELYDRRRAAGLAAASGRLIAILEDRGAPAPDWAERLVTLHRDREDGVIGGGITCADRALAARAVFLCDFARYQPPFPAGPREYVSDINVCYKREVLEAVRELWQERFHETTVHWALRRRGVGMYLSPEPLVALSRGEHPAGWRELLRERMAWGRLFAVTRARESGVSRRLLRVALTPLLPLVLWGRIAAGARRRGGLAVTVAATPMLLVLLGAWAAGEAAGYLTVRE